MDKEELVKVLLHIIENIKNGKSACDGVQMWFDGAWFDDQPKFLYLGGSRKYRIASKTIKVNGVEINAPFMPKEGEAYWAINYDGNPTECREIQYSCIIQTGHAFRTEEDCQQFINACKKGLELGVVSDCDGQDYFRVSFRDSLNEHGFSRSDVPYLLYPASQLTPVSGWVKIDWNNPDTLPENKERVLVICNTGVKIGEHFIDEYFGSLFFNDTDDDYYHDDVTHWMPLPAPPHE